MSLQRVPLNNYRGGLNTRDSPFELQPNESPDLLNVTLTALVGTLQVRAGKTRIDSGVALTAVADNVRQTTVGGSRFLMISSGGKVYYMDTGGVIHGPLFTGTVGTVWDFAQMPDAAGVDKVWMCNGTDAPQKWDGVAGATSAWAGAPLTAWSRILVWKNKLVALSTNTSGVGATTVYLSKTGDPEATTGAFDSVQLRGDDDELGSLTDMNVLADRLYLFKARSVWLMTDPSTFANRRIGEPGCTSRFQSDVCDNKLYFFNEQGLWSTAGVAIAYESGSINNFFPQHLNVSQITKARLLATRDTYERVLLAIPTDGSTTNNTLFEVVPNLNFRRIGGRRYLLLPAFLLHTLPASSLGNFKYGGSQWNVVGGDTLTNNVYQFFKGADDDGVAISAHWKSAWLAVQGEEPYERVRRLNVELSGDAIVDVFKDFNVSPDFSATLPKPVTSSDTTWVNGSIPWEGGIWDPPSTYRFARVRPESRGRFHQVQFRTLPSGSPFLINTAELVVRGGKEH